MLKGTQERVLKASPSDPPPPSPAVLAAQVGDTRLFPHISLVLKIGHAVGHVNKTLVAVCCGCPCVFPDDHLESGLCGHSFSSSRRWLPLGQCVGTPDMGLPAMIRPTIDRCRVVEVLIYPLDVGGDGRLVIPLISLQTLCIRTGRDKVGM